MANWQTYRTGYWSWASNMLESPWYDNGVQTALASVPGALAKDVVTINTGHLIIYDYDNSAGFGYGDVTINGELMSNTAAGTYVFAMSGTYGDDIQGSGTFSAGSSTVPLATNVTFSVSLGNASKFLGSGGLTVNFYCSQPPHPYVKLSANEAQSQTDLSIDTNLTGETSYWAAGKYVAICDIDKAYDYQGPGNTNKRTIVGVSTTPNILELSFSGLDSANIEGAYIFLAERNIDITFNGTQYVFDSCTNCNLRCSVRNTGTSTGSRFISGGSNNIISGIVSGTSYGIYNSTSNTISGYLLGCGLYGIYNSNGNTISGFLNGNNCIVLCSGNSLTGTVLGCTSAFNQTNDNIISGDILGCTNAIYNASNNSISGAITNCTYAFYGGYNKIYRGSTISDNTTDVYSSTILSTSVSGYGARLQSTTAVDSYKQSDIYINKYDAGVFLYDLADATGTPQIGYVKCWMPGGRVWTEAAATVEAVTTTVPVAGEYYHHVYAEDTTAPVFLDTPISVRKNIAICYRCYYYDVDGNWNTLPQIQIVDPTYSFNSASAVLAYSEVENVQNEWQQLTLNYTPTENRNLIVRFIGIGNSTSETRDSYFRIFERGYTPEITGQNVPNDIIPILFNGLTDIVDGRCYPIAAPQNADYPLIVLTITNSEPQARPTAKQDIRLWQSNVQIDCHAENRDAARDLFNLVVVAIENLEDHDEIIQDCTLNNYSEEYVELDGEEQGLFSRQAEYIIWHT